MASSWNFMTVSVAIIILGSIAFGMTGNSYCLIQTIRFRERINLWYLYISIIGAGMGCSVVLASSEMSTLFYYIANENILLDYGAWDVIQLFFYHICYSCACISIIELAVLEKLGYASNTRRSHSSSHVIEYLCVSVQWVIGIVEGAFAVGGMSEYITWANKHNISHTWHGSHGHNGTDIDLYPDSNSAITTTIFIECFNIILGLTVIMTQLMQTYQAIKNEQQGIITEPIASQFVEHWDFLNEDATQRTTAPGPTRASNIVITNERISDANPDGGRINSTHIRFSVNNSKADSSGGTMTMQGPASSADSHIAICSPTVSNISGYTYKRTKASVAETLRKRLGSDFDLSEVSFDISLPGAVDDTKSQRPSMHSSRVTTMETHSQVSASVRSKQSSISFSSTKEPPTERMSQVSANHKGGVSLSVTSAGPSVLTAATSQVATVSQIYTIEEADSLDSYNTEKGVNNEAKLSSMNSSMETTSRRSYFSSSARSSDSKVKQSIFTVEGSSHRDSLNSGCNKPHSKGFSIDSTCLPPLRHTRLAPGHAFIHSNSNMSKASTVTTDDDHVDIKSRPMPYNSFESDQTMSIPCMSSKSLDVVPVVVEHPKVSSTKEHLDVYFNNCPSVMEKVFRWELSRGDLSKKSQGSSITGSLCSNTLGVNEPYFSDPELTQASWDDLRSVSQVRRASSLGSIRPQLNDAMSPYSPAAATLPTKVRIIRPSASDQSQSGKLLYGGRILARKNAVPTLMGPKQAWNPPIPSIMEQDDKSTTRTRSNESHVTGIQSNAGCGSTTRRGTQQSNGTRRGLCSLTVPVPEERRHSIISQIETVNIQISQTNNAPISGYKILVVFILKLILHILCIAPACIRLSCFTNENLLCWQNRPTLFLSESLAFLWLSLIAYVTIHF